MYYWFSNMSCRQKMKKIWWAALRRHKFPPKLGRMHGQCMLFSWYLPIFVYRFRMAIHTYPKIHTICFVIFFSGKTAWCQVHWNDDPSEYTLYITIYVIPYTVLWSIWAKNYHPRGKHTHSNIQVCFLVPWAWIPN